MTGETVITVVGNLTADPELRVTTGGQSVLSCTIASTPRVYDRGSGQWKDGATLFQRAVVYGPQAEHAAESFGRGTRVIAHGKLTQREFETREGDKRTVTELVVDEIGASARYATLAVKKATRSSDQPDEQREDPWSTPWASDEQAVPAGAH
jgi:single-strand DNA-binding protein